MCKIEILGLGEQEGYNISPIKLKQDEVFEFMGKAYRVIFISQSTAICHSINNSNKFAVDKEKSTLEIIKNVAIVKLGHIRIKKYA